MKNFLHNIHLYFAIIFGLFITIICFTGAILVFENDITDAIEHDRLYVQKTDNQPLNIDQLVTNAGKSIQSDAEITGVTVFNNPDKAYQLQLSKPKKAYITVNQYTGEVLSQQERLPFFAFIFKLHRWLLQVPSNSGMSIGKLVVGISTIAFVFIIISGLFIWIPKTKKALKNRLSIETHKGLRRFLYDIHVTNGFYCTIILLSLALTGLTWSFEWYKNGFYALLGANSSQQQTAQQPGKSAERDKNIESKSQNTNKYIAWQSALDELKSYLNDYNQISISNKTAKVSTNRIGNQRATDNYSFDENGKIISTQLYCETSKSDKIKGWVYSLHVGTWGGIITKIMNLIVALIGTSLPATGIYMWYKRRQSKRGNKPLNTLSD